MATAAISSTSDADFIADTQLELHSILGWPEPRGSLNDSLNVALERFCLGATRTATGVGDLLGAVATAALRASIKACNAKSGTVVILDAGTSDVVTIASAPEDDPTIAITKDFQPGSTLKVATFAAGFHWEVLRLDELLDCSAPEITFGEYKVKDEHPVGVATVRDVFKNSSNIGTVMIARRLGITRLQSALAACGLGRATGIFPQTETAGYLMRAALWNDLELAYHSFGMRSKATPLQICAAVCSLARGGRYRAPRVTAQSSQSMRGRFPPCDDPRVEMTVVSPRAARMTLDLMQAVVEPGGTAALAALPNFPLAGKTGTSKMVASFVGVVPADEPRYVVGAFIFEPTPWRYGGEVAAPVVREVARLVSLLA